jgi:hypothetical protein
MGAGRSKVFFDQPKDRRGKPSIKNADIQACAERNKIEESGTEMGRRPLFDRAMTGAERKHRWRERHRHRLPWEEQAELEGLSKWEASAFEPSAPGLCFEPDLSQLSTQEGLD